MGGRLTVDDYGASLKPFLRSKAVIDHKCGQIRMADPAQGDEVGTDPMWDDDDPRPRDWRERAAGDR